MISSETLLVISVFLSLCVVVIIVTAARRTRCPRCQSPDVRRIGTYDNVVTGKYEVLCCAQGHQWERSIS